MKSHSFRKNNCTDGLITGLLAIVVMCLLTTPSLAQKITLNGHLLTDEKRPVPNTRVGVSGKQGGVTDDNGKFSIDLSGDLKEGERVIITVEKRGWVINHPLDGEWNLPNMRLQRVQTLDVIIVPFGSKALWTHARIKKAVTRLADRVAQLKKEREQAKRIDFGDFIRDLASNYGSTPRDAKTAFDEWAEAVKKSTDYHVKGLVDFYNQNFGSAAENFKRAATRSQENAADEWRLAGNSAFAAHNFRDAVESYTQSRSLISKTTFPDKWAEVTHLMAIGRVELGVRVEAQEGLRILAEAEADFREALLIKTRERKPQDWATTQISLGNALQEQAIRTDPADTERLFKEAGAAYHQALSVFTFEAFPESWAGTYLNLGNVLSQQGIGMEGPEGEAPLREAVAAYKQTWRVFTQKDFPKEWAGTQQGLGNTLKQLATRTLGMESLNLLTDAEGAQRKALLIYTRDKMPQEWGLASNSLGNTLKARAVRTEGAETLRLLEQALAIHREALTVFPRESLPQYWAMTQNNVGTDLTELGMRTPGPDGVAMLTQAIEAHRQTLFVYRREELPQSWAMAQNSLARLFVILKDWINAAQSFENFLLVYPDARVAQDAAAYLYHEILFDYEHAVKLNEAWVKRHPKDVSARSNLAENYFTTGRFQECRRLISSLLLEENLDVQIKIALQVIEIANLLALNLDDDVPSRIGRLIVTVQSQPSDFDLKWGFEGSRHFITHSPTISSHKRWLLELLKAISAKGRDVILEGLKAQSGSFAAGETSPDFSSSPAAYTKSSVESNCASRLCALVGI